MKLGSKVLVAALAVATSPLLMLAQGPPPGGPPGGGYGPGPRGPQWGQGYGPQWRQGYGRQGGWGMQRGMRRFARPGMRMRRPMGLGRLAQNPAVQERLGITPEQAAKIQAQESGFAKSRIQSQADLRVKRMELGQLMSAENPDRALIDKKMRELHDAQFAAEKARVDHRLAMRGMLTAEQKDKLKQWQRERQQQRMQRMAPGRGPGFGPGPGGQQPPPPPPPPGEPER